MASFPEPLPTTDRGVSIVSVAIVFATIATFVTAGRFYARYHTRVPIGLDDWVVLASLVAVYAHETLIIIAERYGGGGHHEATLMPENFVMFYKIVTAVQFTFGTSLGLVKISICLFLVRVFRTRPFKIAAYTVMAYSVCWMLMLIAIGAGLCRPIEYNWDKSINGKCGNLNAAYVAVAATDIIGDIMIILLPMPWVWTLQTSRSNKIGLSFVFGLAILDVIVAILRIYYLLILDFVPGADATWNSTGTFIWSAIEPSLANIVASASLLRPVVSEGYFQARSLLSSFRTASRSRSAHTALEDKEDNASTGSTSAYPLTSFSKAVGGVSSTNLRQEIDPRVIRVDDAFSVRTHKADAV